MNIYLDIETLRSPDEHRLQILEDTKANFKAPSGITKGAMAKDLGLDDKEAKFISAGDMKSRWESEMAETKSAEVAQTAWERTSFNPEVAPIACICIGYNIGHGYQNAVFEISDMRNEAEMLEEFHAYIISLCTANGEEIRKVNFIGHNIIKFDLPFIWKRSVINDVETWSGYGNRISADNLCKILNIKGKTEGMDGSLVYDTWQVNPLKVVQYCQDDVEMVKQIHERLTK